LDYSPSDLRYGLIETSASRIGSVLDYFVLTCGIHYENGRYSVDILNVVRLASLLTIALIAIGITTVVRREKRNRVSEGEVVTVDASTLKSV
jgi:hypothetical protein